MTKESQEYHRFIYLMKPTDKGWFIKAQFDGQFKGSIQEVKDLMTVVTLHTEKEGRNEMKWGKLLINIEGYLPKDIGDECHKKLLERIKNKPLSYV